jgi:hypothetical protein
MASDGLRWPPMASDGLLRTHILCAGTTSPRHQRSPERESTIGCKNARRRGSASRLIVWQTRSPPPRHLVTAPAGADMLVSASAGSLTCCSLSIGRDLLSRVRLLLLGGRVRLESCSRSILVTGHVSADERPTLGEDVCWYSRRVALFAGIVLKELMKEEPASSSSKKPCADFNAGRPCKKLKPDGVACSMCSYRKLRRLFKTMLRQGVSLSRWQLISW